MHNENNAEINDDDGSECVHNVRVIVSFLSESYSDDIKIHLWSLSCIHPVMNSPQRSFFPRDGNKF